MNTFTSQITWLATAWLFVFNVPVWGQVQHVPYFPGMISQEIPFSYQKAGNFSFSAPFVQASQAENFYFLHLYANGLTDSCQKMLFSDYGIQLLSSLNAQEYLAAIPCSMSEEDLRRLPIQQISSIAVTEKLAPGLFTSPPAFISISQVVLSVGIFAPISITSATAHLTQLGYELAPLAHREDRIQIMLSYDDHFQQKITLLASLPYIARIEWPASPSLPANIEGVRRHGISYAHHLPGLDGAGVVIGVGDGGYVAPHVDLDQRVVNQATTILPGYANHCDHVTGTIGGAGNRLPIHGGMAPAATLLTDQTTSIWANATTYHQQHGMVLTNNSYAEPFNCLNCGQYTLDSYTIDQQANTLPSLLQIFSVANEGSKTCAPFPKGYHTINGGYTSAKNNLVVGALDAAGEIASYSSQGPAADGRLKPEICAVGTGLMSTVPFDAYNTFSGTSMAAATVTGAMALLYQQYRKLHNGDDPEGALIKAIACNSAQDYGLPGPDFRYGFGALDLENAITTLTDGRHASGTISQGQTQSPITITVPAGAHALKVMLCWTDPAALPNNGATLINDLNLSVTDPSASQFLSWTLNPNGFGVLNPAVRGIDTLNNIEQVTISNPTAGTYSVSVAGERIPVGTQKYYISYEIESAGLALKYPVAGDALVPGEIIRLWWQAKGVSGGNFELEYSENGGNTWQAISTELITARDRSWQVPATATAAARVRVRHSLSGVSSSSGDFTIMGIPVLSATVPCDGKIDLSWNSVAGAAYYEVMMLDTSMKAIDTLVGTSYQLSNLSPSEDYWLTVRAMMTHGQAGRRCQAIKITPSGAGACPSPYDLALTQLMNPQGTGRANSVTAFSAVEDVQVEIHNMGTSTVNGFRLCYQVNGGPVVSDSVLTPLPPGATINYTFNQQVDLLAAGTYTIFAWLDCQDDEVYANDSTGVTVRQLNNPPLTLPYTEGFETGINATYTSPYMGLEGMDCVDYEQGGAGGRLRTNAGASFPIAGNRALSMDAIASAGPVPHYAVMTFNLAAYQGIPNLFLDFSYMQHGEEGHPEDKLWVRGNELDPWLELYNWYDSCGVVGVYHQAEKIPVSALLASANQALTSTFQLRIGQQDDSAAVTLMGVDGLTIDEVKVYQYAPPLTFSCLNNQTLAATSGCTVPIPDYRPLLGVGGGVSPSVTQLPLSGTPIQGSNLVTLIVDDPISGQRDTCTMFVSVQDNTPPALNCPSSQTLALDNNCQAVLPDYSALATASDNCGIPIVTQTPISGISLTTSQTITLTASDGFQQTTCTFALTLSDNTPPAIACPSNQVITFSSNCPAQIPDLRSLVQASDNCQSGLVITQSPPPGTNFTSPITVTMSTTDGSHSVNCSFSVIGTTLSLSETHIDESAAGAADGSIDLTVLGGVAPFIFTWSNGSTTEDLTGIGGGTYQVTVTDYNGCTESLTLTLSTTTPVSSTPLLHHGHLTGVGNTWQTISLPASYKDMVVVASILIPSGATPAAVPRIRNATGNSFDLRIQATDGSSTATYEVYYVVAEEGVYTLAGDGIKMEVVKANASLTSGSGSWSLEARTLQQSYSSPVVLGQIMTENDANWSVFWATAHNSRTNPPASGSLAAGKHRGEDPISTRQNETIGYIVLEAGSGSLGALKYLAGLGADIVSGVGNTTTGYAYSLSGFTKPSAAIVSAAAMDGGNGGWPVLFGTNPLTSSQLTLAFDEDQSKDTERSHTTEQVAYLILEETGTNPCPPIHLSLTTTDETCNGASDGTSLCTPTGGASPYTYNWSNGATFSSLTNLSPATYSVTVTDANGCTANGSATVAPAAAISLSVSATDETCAGGDGTANTSVTGGNAPFSYTWSNGATSANLTSLAAGTYSVAVTDANGCSANGSATVAPTAAISLSVSATDETCAGGDGTANTSVTGGNAPFSYTWSNGATSANLTSLAAGTYSVTVTDANGCTASGSVSIAAAPLFGLSISATDVRCPGGSDGSATVTPLGGTGPYSFAWSNGGSSSTIAGLAAGNYGVFVTDANGCQTDAFAQINQPFALTLSLSATNESVPNALDGTISLTANGGTTPYSYSWSNGATSKDLNGLSGGTYAVTLTDANGCIAIDSATVQTIPATGPIVAFEQGVISGVSDFWLTIPLTYTYTEMVVVAIVKYPNNTVAPVVTRIRNAAGSSFDLMLQNPSDASLGSYEVHYMVAEAGVYNMSAHGIKMEAVRATSLITARKGSWQREGRTYQQSYASPVVLGQVMSYNDAKWSVFWASEQADRRNPPSATSLAAGKHVGADVVTTRANETIGYMVFEAGNGLVNGIGYEAGVGIDAIKGVQNSASGYKYPLSGMSWAGSAILSTAGADVGDGGWPVLMGNNPLTSSQLTLSIDEDQIADTERKHGTEQVAYIVFGNITSNVRLAETLTSEGLRLYPQPAKDWVTVKWASVGEGNYQIDLLDVQGRKISSHDISILTPGIAERVSLSHLSPGMYIMRIWGNGFDESRKFVKL